MFLSGAVNCITCFTLIPKLFDESMWQDLVSHLGIRNTIFIHQANKYSLADGESLLSSLLLGEFDLLLVLALDLLGLLSNVELNMAVGRKIGRDSTVGSVSSSSTFASSLGANMGDSA